MGSRDIDACQHDGCGDPGCIRCERAMRDGTWARTILCEYHFAGLAAGKVVRNPRYVNRPILGEALFPALPGAGAWP